MGVAGVLIHGDFQSKEIDKRIDSIKERFIPTQDRENISLHSTDIYHGSRYFDRNRWQKEYRFEMLIEISKIISDFQLPIVSSFYYKDQFCPDCDWRNTKPDHKKMLIHAAAAMDCAISAERWLEKYAPSENGMIICEDNNYIKNMLKKTFNTLRKEEIINQSDLKEMKHLGLPLNRIIDTPHFASKKDCASLQLADLCAFTISRIAKNKSMISSVKEIILRHARWQNIYSKN